MILVLDDSQSEKKDGSESVNSSLSQSEDSSNQNRSVDAAPKKPKIEPVMEVTTGPPPVIYHPPIHPPIPMVHQHVTQRQLQVQAKINDIFKPAASKKSNLQKSAIPNSDDPIIIENEPKKSASSDIILLSSDDETEKKRQRKRLSDAANFVSRGSAINLTEIFQPTSKKRKSDGKSSTSFRDLKENIRKDKQFSNGLSFLDRLGDYNLK